MVEHTAVNRGVVGSSPTRGAKNNMATWPSGKAKVCNTSITSSNLVGASDLAVHSSEPLLFLYHRKILWNSLICKDDETL